MINLQQEKVEKNQYNNFMKIKLAIISILTIGFASCGMEDAKITTTQATSMMTDKVVTQPGSENKGYELMTQKCFICHFKTPDPSRRDQMIAPPMLRVQEHYKPAYPNKEEFVKAVMAIVNNPSEENTLMPGAVRKFNVMPKVEYDQQELKLIAEAIFDTDFGSSHKRGKMHDEGIALNDGSKWKLKKISMDQINDISNKLNAFSSDDLEDYNQLGKDIFNGAKKLMAEDAYEGEKFEQIHNFFHGVENNMRPLMATKSMDEAKGLVSELNVKFGAFGDYFEVGY